MPLWNGYLLTCCWVKTTKIIFSDPTVCVFSSFIFASVLESGSHLVFCAQLTWCVPATSVVVEPGLTCIGDYAFDNGLPKAKSITLPETLTSIGDEAFSQCAALTEITIPEGVTSLGFHAFAACASHESFSFLWISRCFLTWQWIPYLIYIKQKQPVRRAKRFRSLCINKVLFHYFVYNM